VEKAKTSAKGIEKGKVISDIYSSACWQFLERVMALAEHNRVRFDTLKGVVEKYLDKCGRQWVAMDSLFGKLGFTTWLNIHFRRWTLASLVLVGYHESNAASNNGTTCTWFPWTCSVPEEWWRIWKGMRRPSQRGLCWYWVILGRTKRQLRSNSKVATKRKGRPQRMFKHGIKLVCLSSYRQWHSPKSSLPAAQPAC
jgi:hypothetical protein